MTYNAIEMSSVVSHLLSNLVTYIEGLDNRCTSYLSSQINLHFRKGGQVEMFKLDLWNK